jgi:hypothetical protein
VFDFEAGNRCAESVEDFTTEDELTDDEDGNGESSLELRCTNSDYDEWKAAICGIPSDRSQPAESVVSLFPYVLFGNSSSSSGDDSITTQSGWATESGGAITMSRRQELSGVWLDAAQCPLLAEQERSRADEIYECGGFDAKWTAIPMATVLKVAPTSDETEASQQGSQVNGLEQCAQPAVDDTNTEDGQLDSEEDLYSLMSVDDLSIYGKSSACSSYGTDDDQYHACERSGVKREEESDGDDSGGEGEGCEDCEDGEDCKASISASVPSSVAYDNNAAAAANGMLNANHDDPIVGDGIGGAIGGELEMLSVRPDLMARAAEADDAYDEEVTACTKREHRGDERDPHELDLESECMDRMDFDASDTTKSESKSESKSHSNYESESDDVHADTDDVGGLGDVGGLAEALAALEQRFDEVETRIRNQRVAIDGYGQQLMESLHRRHGRTWVDGAMETLVPSDNRDAETETARDNGVQPKSQPDGLLQLTETIADDTTAAHEQQKSEHDLNSRLSRHDDYDQYLARVDGGVDADGESESADSDWENDEWKDCVSAEPDEEQGAALRPEQNDSDRDHVKHHHDQRQQVVKEQTESQTPIEEVTVEEVHDKKEMAGEQAKDDIVENDAVVLRRQLEQLTRLMINQRKAYGVALGRCMKETNGLRTRLETAEAAATELRRELEKERAKTNSKCKATVVREVEPVAQPEVASEINQRWLEQATVGRTGSARNRLVL